MNRLKHRPCRRRPPSRGFVLIYTLIALTVLLIAGVTLTRAMNSNLLQAGNLAYQNDLTNFAQRGVRAARTALVSGALNTEALRSSDLKAANYASSRLTTLSLIHI